MLKNVVLMLLFFSMSIFAKNLKIWIMPNGANPKGTLEEIVKPFEKKYGVKVDVEVLDWGVAWSKISSSLEKKQGPNVLQMGTTWLGHFIEKNELANLSDFYNKQQLNRFYSVSLNTCKLYNDSIYYAVPWFIDVRVLLANKLWLDSAKIDVNRDYSYSEFKENLKKIKNSNFKLSDGTKVYPFSFPGKSDWNIPHNFAPWIWSNGGDFLKFYNNKWHSAILEKESVAGIYSYLDFVFDSLINTATLKENTSNVTQRFIRGEFAYIVSTIDVIKQLKFSNNSGGLMDSPIGKMGVYSFMMPKGNKGSFSFVGGSNLVIPKKYENDKMSMKLLKFLSEKQQLNNYCLQLGFIPPDTSLWKDWNKNRLYNNVFKALKTGKAYPQLSQWGDIEGNLVACFSDVWGLMDSYYSDSLLYNVLDRYNNKLNEKLKSSSDKVSYDEFKKIASIFNDTTSIINNSVDNKNSINSNRMYIIVILMILSLFGIGLLLKRK